MFLCIFSCFSFVEVANNSLYKLSIPMLQILNIHDYDCLESAFTYLKGDMM